jgi:hypothetical protein
MMRRVPNSRKSTGSNRVYLSPVFAAWMAMLFTGCSISECGSKPSPKEDEKIQEESQNYTMKIPLPLTQEIIWELAGPEAIKKAGLTFIAGMQIANPEFEKLMLKAGVVSGTFFSDWIGFSHIGQTKDACGYGVLTSKDNTVVTGKYTMKATLRQATTGGPMGSATERYIEVDQLKLAQRTVRPGKKVFERPRVVVPGERIVRMISPKESEVDDTYLINFGLPPNTKVWVDFFGEEKARQPLVDRSVDRYYRLKLTNEAGLEIPFESFNSRDFFHTRAVEKYLLRITATMRSDNRPDRYVIVITFGGFPGGSDDYDHSRAKWSSGRKYD